MSNFLDKTGLSYFWEKVKSWSNNRFYKKTGGDLDGDITFVKKEGQVARSIGFGNTGADGAHLTFSGNAIQFSGPEGSFLAMSGKKIELLGDASMDTDAVTYKQLKERTPSSPGNSQIGWVATVIEDGAGGVKPEWKELPDMIEVEGGATAQIAESIGAGPYTIEFTEEVDDPSNPFLVFDAQTIATSAWAADTTYEGWGFRAAVALSGVTADHVPSVTFGIVDATSGNLAPVSDTYDGGVYIYAKEQPMAAVSVASVVCIKGV